MNLLLDTHVAFWVLYDSKRLAAHIRSLIESEAGSVFVSHIGLWEIAIKYPLGRWNAPPASAADTAKHLLETGYGLLPLDFSHVLAAERLPLLHGDPFDRLLIAQALTENLRFVTHDRKLTAYSDTIVSW